MPKWIKNIHWGKTLGIGVLFTIISMVVRQIEMIWTLKYYLDPNYFGLWSKLMMPTSGPPPFEFFIISFIANSVTGIGIACLYYYVKDYLPKNYWKRSFLFADIIVTTSFLFFTIPVALLFHVPFPLLGYWFLSSFFVATSISLLIVRVVGVKNA